MGATHNLKEGEDAMKRTRRLLSVLVLAASVIVLWIGSGKGLSAQSGCCGPSGAPCLSSTDCCTYLVCDTSMPACVSCIQQDDSGCKSANDCCSPSLCDTTASQCVSCIPALDFGCQYGSDCCQPAACLGGKCRPAQ